MADAYHETLSSASSAGRFPRTLRFKIDAAANHHALLIPQSNHKLLNLSALTLLAFLALLD